VSCWCAVNSGTIIGPDGSSTIISGGPGGAQSTSTSTGGTSSQTFSTGVLPATAKLSYIGYHLSLCSDRCIITVGAVGPRKMHSVGTYVHMSLFLACRALLCVAGNWQELLRSRSPNGQLLGGRHAFARGSESSIDLSMSTRAPDSGSILPEPCSTSCCLGRTKL
jgi:hypothetical protein